jgi:NAD(P)-dependent dehydrogenase (short-subunit alcohol dehydrogenase family)
LSEDIQRRVGRLDVLICAAGVLRGAYLQPDEFPLEEYDTVMDVNVKGIFLCAKYAAPQLEASGRGVILIVASDAGIKAPSVSLAYAASKAGANGLGMTLEQRLRERNIRVNVLCPGDIDTALRREIITVQAERQGRSPAEAIAQAQRDFLGKPEGVARVLAFLASEEADYVRGLLMTR